MESNISIWTNKWTDVFDFTAHKTADDGTPNWMIKQVLYDEMNVFIPSLEKAKEKLQSLRKVHGDELKTIRGYDDEVDLGMIDIHVEDHHSF